MGLCLRKSSIRSKRFERRKRLERYEPSQFSPGSLRALAVLRFNCEIRVEN